MNLFWIGFVCGAPLWAALAFLVAAILTADRETVDAPKPVTAPALLVIDDIVEPAATPPRPYLAWKRDHA